MLYLVITMATAYNPKLVTSGLVMYLDAGNPASYPGNGTTWNDLSGNGNSCTLVNGPGYSQEAIGNITFDGTNDYGEVAHSSSINLNSLTMCIWFKYASLPSSPGAMLIGKHNAAGSQNGWQIYITSGGGVVPSLKAPTTENYIDGGILATNRWHNLTLTINSGASMIYYVNGAVIGSVAIPVTTTNTNPLRIADSLDTFWSVMGCSIGQVQIYNRALSAGEISSNFTALRGRYGV